MRVCRNQSSQQPPRQPQQGQGNRRGRGRPLRNHQVEVSRENGEQLKGAEDIADIMRVHAVSPSAPRSYKVSLEINKIPITMELDMGASVSLVSEATWADKLNKPQLPTTLYLITAELSQQKPQDTGTMSGGGQCVWERSQPTTHSG